MTKPPTSLNSDADWAKAIAWLQHHGRRLIVPARGPPLIETYTQQKTD